MKSFDEWLDEYWEVNHNFPCAGEAWDYKQAEIDELKMSNHNLSKQINDAGDYYDYEKNRADELRKRIDEALYCLRKDVELYGMSDDVEIAINHLKGNTNED